MAKQEVKCEPMRKLTAMRALKGLTLQDLADKSGISYTTISRYENGLFTPKLENLKIIAEVLGCELTEII